MSEEVQQPVVSRVTSEEFQMQARRSETNRFSDVIESRLKYEPDYAAYCMIRYSARRMIPYGRWTCADGREVIFNREYQPIYDRVNGVSKFCDRAEYVRDIVKVEYFYNDANSPMDYLTRKLKPWSLQRDHAARCKESLAICMNIMNEYEPKNDGWNGTSWNAFLFCHR